MPDDKQQRAADGLINKLKKGWKYCSVKPRETGGFEPLMK